MSTLCNCLSFEFESGLGLLPSLLEIWSFELLVSGFELKIDNWKLILATFNEMGTSMYCVKGAEMRTR